MSNTNYTNLVGQKAYAHTGELLGFISDIEVVKFAPQPHDDYDYDVIATVKGSKHSIAKLDLPDVAAKEGRPIAHKFCEDYHCSWDTNTILYVLYEMDYKWDGFALCWYDNVKQ